jgi:hypothetical protein
MVRQQPDQRPASIEIVKNELIGRGNEFVRMQHLEALRNEVVPESEVSDALISDPIRAVEKLDYRHGVLTLRLNRAVNKRWEQCFRVKASAFSVNVSSAMMSFEGDRVLIRVNENFILQGVEFFKQYCVSANEEYAVQIRREHQQEIERKRGELRRRILEDEARMKALAKFSL